MIKAFKKYWNLVISWFEDDWHDVYVDSQLNHGQGPKMGERWNENS